MAGFLRHFNDLVFEEMLPDRLEAVESMGLIDLEKLRAESAENYRAEFAAKKKKQRTPQTQISPGDSMPEGTENLKKGGDRHLKTKYAHQF
ncbi:hypothetical protein [Limnoraphis robusta]|uniref:Transposase n=1 Tax=Limnoraphis robusta CCNP1315 TaxID=3110306 RepID=A0ABU5U2A6_9CYAN|nr:hypothetical protein [Limnoraphis robusta]MEA5521336.1 hypothetical protein [Limnoraphis robusta CCNP1315]MEA5548909.1 hypothetical protein [Limnoraphis robusta CCNP1324]